MGDAARAFGRMVLGSTPELTIGTRRGNNDAFGWLSCAKGYTRKTHGRRQEGKDKCKLRP